MSGLSSEREAEIRAYAEKQSPSEPGLQAYVCDLLAALDHERALGQRLAAAMQGARNQLDVELEDYREARS